MPQPPNILLITTDQQHWNTLGAINPRIHTPALDRLAAEGSRFTRAYCNNPVCSPSRSTMLTGLYPSQHGCWSIGVKLPEDVPTISGILSEQGYATSLIGKAHFHPTESAPGQESIERHPILRDLDFWRRFHGPWYGFQHVELSRAHAGEHLVGAHYALWMEEKGLKNWRDYFDAWPADGKAYRRHHHWDLPEEFHYSTWTAERTIAAIDGGVQDDEPFFVWASFHDPHPPYLVPAPWDSLYDPAEMEPGKLAPGEMDQLAEHFHKTQEDHPDYSDYHETPYHTHGFNSHRVEEARSRKDMAVYYGMISFVDQQVGRILDRLDGLGITNNTIVVFTTDHGHFTGQHGLWHKGPFHYEDLLRLPFLVRQPGTVARGAVSASLQSLVDLAPTFLTAAGLEPPGMMQGVSQWDVWQGRRHSARSSVIVENRDQPTRVHLRTYIEDRYKLTIYRDRPEGELFDLQDDPGELFNRWNDPAWATIRCGMFQRFLNAELCREPMRFPRIAGA